jgi:protein tyrosine phosphatase
MQSDDFLSRSKLRSRIQSTDTSFTALKDLSDDSKFLKAVRLDDLPLTSLKKQFSCLKKITCGEEYASGLVKATAELKPLNRYKNVLPFESTLVKLDDGLKITPENYINANFVGDLEQDSEQPPRFIATQGPLLKTAASFWRMVLKYKIPLIVAIVEPNSLGDRCHPYWPQDFQKSIHFENLIIEKIEECESTFMNLRSLVIFDKVTKDSAQVTHVHVKTWNDGMALKKSAFEDFLELLKLIFAYFQDYPGSPVAVHCSAGIGRTCTLIASFFLYQKYLKCLDQNAEFEFSVYGLVKHLRGQRWQAVQTYDQYVFLFEIVRYFSLA